METMGKSDKTKDMVDMAQALLDLDPRPDWLAKALVEWMDKEKWESSDVMDFGYTLDRMGVLHRECAFGVVLSLLALTSQRTQILMEFSHFKIREEQQAQREGVEAFFKALASSRAAMENLRLFGTLPEKTGAALGRCLNTNASLRKLQLEDPGKAPWWKAFSKLIGNATLRELHLHEGDPGMRFGRDLAAVVNRFTALSDLELVLWQERDVEEVRQILTPLLTNPASTITSLTVRTKDENLTEAVIVVTAEALLQTPSTKLEALFVSPFALAGTFSVKAPMCEKVAEMLRSNTALKSLSYELHEFQGSAIVDAMSENHRLGLEELSLRLDQAGATALFLLLTPPDQMSATALAPSAATVALPQLRTLWVWYCKGDAKALARMLQRNTTLVELDIRKARYSSEEWGEILPALESNTTLESLDLTSCEGVDGEAVYKVITDLLRENTSVREINVDRTPLERAGKAEAITQALRRNVEYRAALADASKVPAKSGRLVLCGYPKAGKTQLLLTMRSIKQQQLTKTGPQEPAPGETSSCSVLDSACAGQEETVSTRGIEIVMLTDEKDLRISVWDFAGQPEYYALHDCVFPDTNGSTIFLFVYNPLRKGTAHDKRRDLHQRLEYWLRFICSNSRPEHPIKPMLMVVVTHQDEAGAKVNRQEVGSIVTRIGDKFKGLIHVETKEFFLLNAKAHEQVTTLLTIIEKNFTQLLKGLLVPTICNLVLSKLEEWAKNARGDPFLSTAMFDQLVHGTCQSEVQDTTPSLGKIVASYLRDAGAIIYFEDLDFIVIDPHWFGHAIFGYLIHPTSLGEQDEPGFKPNNGIIHADQVDEFLESSLRRINASKGITIPTDMLIRLMKGFNLCYDYVDEDNEVNYLFPILMEGATSSFANNMEDVTHPSVKGERKLLWTDANMTDVYVGFRLHCGDAERTFLTPGFFPRLQIILYKECVSKGWVVSNDPLETNLLDVNMFHISINGEGHEIIVEYSSQVGYFVDVLVRSKRSYTQAVTFVEEHFIAKVRKFCGSQQGCIGVSLVQSLIRKECVRSLTLCKYRTKNFSLLISKLKDQIAQLPDNLYIHEWQAIEGSDPPLASGSEYATLIKEDIIFLDDNKQLVLNAALAGNDARSRPGEHSPFGPIYLTRNIGIWQKFVSRLYCGKVVPLRLHVHCFTCNGNRAENNNLQHGSPTYMVASQQGRIFYLMDKGTYSRQSWISGVYSCVCWMASMGTQFAPFPGAAMVGSLCSNVGPLRRTPFCDKVIEDLLEAHEEAASVSIDILITRLQEFLNHNPEYKWKIEMLSESTVKKYFGLTKVRVPSGPYLWICHLCLEHDKVEQKYLEC